MATAPTICNITAHRDFRVTLNTGCSVYGVSEQGSFIAQTGHLTVFLPVDTVTRTVCLLILVLFRVLHSDGLFWFHGVCHFMKDLTAVGV